MQQLIASQALNRPNLVLLMIAVTKSPPFLIRSANPEVRNHRRSNKPSMARNLFWSCQPVLPPDIELMSLYPKYSVSR